MLTTDVIVIGGGCAGMTAALEAAAIGAAVALLDRTGLGVGTNSALSNGFFSGPTPHCTEDEYIRNPLVARKGYAPAAKAGLNLWDMEFVQFFPLVIAEPGLPSQVLFFPHPKETRVLNQSGESILEKYQISLNEAMKTRRDGFSAILFKEDLRGPVYLLRIQHSSNQ